MQVVPYSEFNFLEGFWKSMCYYTEAAKRSPMDQPILHLLEASLSTVSPCNPFQPSSYSVHKNVDTSDIHQQQVLWAA